MNGTVAKVFPNKNFGFLRGEDKQDYFFHAEDLDGFFADLVNDFDGNREIKVTFEIGQSSKGPRAKNVVRVDGGI